MATPTEGVLWPFLQEESLGHHYRSNPGPLLQEEYFGLSYRRSPMTTPTGEDSLQNWIC